MSRAPYLTAIVLAALVLLTAFAGCTKPTNPRVEYVGAMVEARGAMMGAAMNGSAAYVEWQHGNTSGEAAHAAIVRAFRANQDASRVLNGADPAGYFPTIKAGLLEANGDVHRALVVLRDFVATGDGDPNEAIERLQHGVAMMDRLGPMMARAVREA